VSTYPPEVAMTATVPADRRIAVIGMAGRFPGAATLEQYWEDILAGACRVDVLGPAELAADGMPPDGYDHPDYVGASGRLADIDHFDAEFFGISPREAALTDPQQRLFLQVAYHALEDAGYAVTPPGTRVGVYAGTGMTLYSQQTYLLNNLRGCGRRDQVGELQLAIGNVADFAATRVAYRLGLTGPAVAVQTACSTSLVAVHLAVQALLVGDADMALVGAAAVHVPQNIGYRYVEGSILSRRGRCCPFSADADGTVGGNGVAAILLKPLDRARADGDPIRAVILGTAVTNDGAQKAGFTAPGVAGQAAAVQAALDRAGVEPSTIGYIEAHGTGTPMGDPIEVAGLTRAFRSGTDQTGFCALGSVKANIGHLDCCAGLAGLIKTVFILESGQIPPQIHMNGVNPALELDRTPFYVSETARDWPDLAGPRRAGVSSLGVGGTNAHVILEQPPVPSPSGQSIAAPGLLPLSARTPRALTVLAGRYRDKLSTAAPSSAAAFAGATAGRAAHPYRLGVLGATTEELASALDRFAATGRASRAALTGVAPESGQGPVGFLYPGQGRYERGLARGLYQRFAVFRSVVDACDAQHRELWGTGLLSALITDESAERMPTELLQPVLFTAQMAHTRLWQSLGVEPGHVIGHSVGEFAALCTAGALTLEDGLYLTAVRGRLTQELTAEGAMLAVMADEQVYAEAINRHPALELAAVNSESQRVLAGPAEVIRDAQAWLSGRGVKAVLMATDRAFHSAMMEPMLDAFRSQVAEVSFSPLAIPMSSTCHVDGQYLPAGWVPDEKYFWRQVRDAVRLDLALADAVARGIRAFVDAGPGKVMSGLARPQHPGCTFLVPWATPESAESDFVRAVAQWFCLGGSVRWDRLAPSAPRVPMPAYPFEPVSHWIPAPGQASSPQQPVSPEVASPMTEPEPSPTQDLTGHVMHLLRECTARHLLIEADDVQPDVSFLDLGTDSLDMINLLREAEQIFAVRISPREMFEVADTPARLATLVVERLDRAHAMSLLKAAAQRAVPDATPEPHADLPAPLPVTSATPLPVLAAVPAVPAAEGVPPAGGLPGLVEGQLRVMEHLAAVMTEQLNALRGTTRAPSAHAQSAAVPPAAGLPATGPGSSATGKPAPASAQSPVRVEAISRGPRVVVPTTSGMAAVGNTAQQREHVGDLTRRFQAATQTSKDIAQRYRVPLADTRAVVGFRSATKEMHYPIAARRGCGSRLEDVDGNEYVDISMGFGVLLFGHDAPFISEAVRRHLADGLRLGPRSAETGEVAEMLARITGMDRVAFATSGTEANSGAIRLARAYTGRSKVVMFDGSYHGHIDQVLGRTIRSGQDWETFPVSIGIPHSAVSEAVVLEYGNPESLEVIRRVGPQLAAVLVEPVQSRRPGLQPVDFLRSLRDITHESGSVLLFDEMLTGFRPHLRGAQGVFGVTADLATYGKALGGGFPVGAIAGRADIMDSVDGGFWRYGDDSFPQKETTFYGGTYLQHPLTMAAALAVLNHLEQESPGLQDRINRLTQHLADTLNSFFEEEEYPLRVRHFGSMFKFEYRGDMELLFHHLILNGVYVWEWRSFYLSSAHTAEDVEFVIEAVKKSLRDMRAGGFLPANSARTAAGDGHNVDTGRDPGGRQHLGTTAPLGIVEEAPLTSTQKDIWIEEKTQNVGGRNNEFLAVQLDGSLNLAALEAGLCYMFNRHAALRTVFREVGEEPRQIVLDRMDCSLHLVDRVGANPDEALREAVAREAQRRFDLENGPLLSASLLRLRADRHVLLLSAHHLIIDSHSERVLTSELSECYRAHLEHRPPSLLPLTRTYAQHASEERARIDSAAAQAGMQYWTDLLRDPVPELRLASDRPHPQVGGALRRSFFRMLPAELCDQLRDVSKKSRATLFITLTAVFAAVLREISGQDQIMLSIPLANRPHGTENIVGFFANNIVLRLNLAGAATPGALIRSVREELLNAQEHEDVPFGDAVRALQREHPSGRHPVFQVRLEFEREELLKFDLPGLTASVMPVTIDKAPFDLVLYLTTTATGIHCRFEYNTQMLDEPAVERIATSLESGAWIAVRNPDQPLGARANARRTRTDITGRSKTTKELP
jgi:iturin family lipopeptide synthetase A